MFDSSDFLHVLVEMDSPCAGVTALFFGAAELITGAVEIVLYADKITL